MKGVFKDNNSLLLRCFDFHAATSLTSTNLLQFKVPCGFPGRWLVCIRTKCAGCVCLRARLLLQLVAMQEFIQQSGFVGRCGLPGKPFKSADAVLQVLLRTVGVFTCSLTEGDV